MIQHFREEGDFWSTFYRKAKCKLIGAKPEWWVLKKYVNGTTLNVGCGKHKFKNTIGVDNLMHRTYTNWEVRPHINADALDLPFKNGTVDTVIAMHLWEHIEHPHLFISECFRVLKRGGKLCLMLPNGDYLHPKVYWRDPTHKWCAKPLEVFQQFRNNSWRVIQFNKLGLWGYHWSFDIVAEKQ